jgi:bifunctional UDP-N-acetylglucosamine pyrophosphorylase/glucosamine-1-phosphate N-acetyltransferase
MVNQKKAASVILAAGRGSRMKGYEGNKTLLPLIPKAASFDGSHPMLIEVIQNLPSGHKALVVNYKKSDVIAQTFSMGLTYCEQPITNGTGGALIAAEKFIEKTDEDKIIVTMGDTPLVRKPTYEILIHELDSRDMVVAGFKPANKGQYGALEIDNDRVQRITEWKYWKDYPQEQQKRLTIFNSGIYAFHKQSLLSSIELLKENPHKVEKERDGQKVIIEEFFITDILEFMIARDLNPGYIVIEDETEVMGVDTPEALAKAQKIYLSRLKSSPMV